MVRIKRADRAKEDYLGYEVVQISDSDLPASCLALPCLARATDVIYVLGSSARLVSAISSSLTRTKRFFVGSTSFPCRSTRYTKAVLAPLLNL